MIATSFWSADGKPITAEEFLRNSVRQTAGLLQRRRGTARASGPTRSRAKPCSKNWQMPGIGKEELTSSAIPDQCRKERPVRCAGICRPMPIQPITREVAGCQGAVQYLLARSATNKNNSSNLSSPNTLKPAWKNWTRKNFPTC